MGYENRPIDESEIDAFLQRGFRRWTVENLDRLYINSAQLGLSCCYYDTGNIKNAEFGGKPISNSRAAGLKSAKTFIDVKTGRIFTDRKYPELRAACEEIVEEILFGLE
ncbi:MAG: hypothetical protein IKS98_08165 [Lachnospiraceae bacterium]|nr:hypothetical protein [Lachnospiraceae bacterium]